MFCSLKVNQNDQCLVTQSPRRMHSSRKRTVRCSSHRGKEFLPGGCLPGGVSACREVYTSPPPLWTDFYICCENITFPQLLLRTVNIKSQNHKASKHSCSFIRSRNYAKPIDSYLLDLHSSNSSFSWFLLRMHQLW